MSAALVLTIFIAPEFQLRAILGLIFLLFLPGYVATAALFPEKGRIDIIERIALSFGLSIAIVPLTGLALNYTPFGIRLDPILTVLFAFILIVSLVAWRRRMYLPEDERFRIDVSIDLSMKDMPMIDKLLTVGIVITLVATVTLLAYVIAVPRSGESFTQLALLGPDMKAKDYPRNLTVGEVALVHVSVGSFETSKRNYSLVICLQRQNSTTNVTHWSAADPFAGPVPFDEGLAYASNFSLSPGEYNNNSFRFSISETGTFKLRFMLFLEGQSVSEQPYREVYLWLFVT
ncbi:MAG: DUF1616 domain-containing protein [Thermoplasmata archaeon]